MTRRDTPFGCPFGAVAGLVDLPQLDGDGRASH